MSHVVIDELHLMLRITDVLTENVICEVMERDKRESDKKALNGQYLRALVTAMRDCGISFSVWEKVDADGCGSGKYDWTSLMGMDNKKKRMSNLLNKLQGTLHDETAETAIKVWQVRKLSN